MRIAIDAASPAAMALDVERPSTAAMASAQNAVTGTSLIGAMSMNRNAGLVATSAAAATPATGCPSRRPSPYVASTSTPPRIGTTQNAAQWPATVCAAAISSGNPGE